MHLSRRRWYWQLLVSLVITNGVMPFYSPSGILRQAVCLLGLTFSDSRTNAQIIPDTTLGAESSVVTPQAPDSSVDVIQGGATRGANLFHSFEQFSVTTGGVAYFSNALNIQNIISRVTGGSISNIDGLIRANGTANLFLLNPNGIIFGPNASLNIGGSFVGSTASSLKFADTTEFSARNPANPLLTISVPIGLQFNGTEGNIIVRAGNSSSNAFTENGDAGQLLNTAQPVNSQPSGANLRTISGTLSNVNDVDLYQIYLNGSTGFDATTVNGSAVDTQLFLFDAGGLGIYSNDDRDGTRQSTIPPFVQPFSRTSSGTYYLGISSWENNPYSLLGYIFGSDYATGPGAGSPLSGWDANGSDNGAYTITLYGSEFATSNRLQVQPGKTLALVGGQVSLEGTVLRVPGSQVEIGGLAAPGTVKLNIDPGSSNLMGLTFPDKVARADVAIASSATNNTLIDVAAGGGGSVTINGHNIDILGFGGDQDNFTDDTSTTISAGIARGQGFSGAQAGDITFNATGAITTSTFTFINNDVSFDGALGNGGNITIKAESFSSGAGALSASTFGTGNAGSILLDISGNVYLGVPISAGVSLGGPIFFNTLDPDAVGTVGGITVKAGSLTLNDALLTANTRGSGSSGNILLDVKGRVELKGEFGSRLFTNVNGGESVLTDAMGNGGEIRIQAGSLFLSQESGLIAETAGQGNAGSIFIEAPGGEVSFDQSVALTRLLDTAKGAGGNIYINARSLSLTNGAQLIAETAGQGDAGTIRINAADSVTVIGASGPFFPGLIGQFDGPSRLSTRTASSSRGGDILINTNSFRVVDTAILDAQTTADGAAGNITVNANTFEATSGGQLLTTTSSSGRSGNITLGSLDRGVNSVTLSGNNSGLFASTDNKSSGEGGSITLYTGSLTVTDGARLQALTFGKGNAGNVRIQANTFAATNGGQVLTTTRNSGRAGDITLDVTDNVTLSGSDPTYADRLAQFGRNIVNDEGAVSGLFANTTEGSTGQGGSIMIETGRLNVRDGAEVDVSSAGAGVAGNLTVSAGSIRLDNALLSSNTTAGQGNINLRSQDLVLRRGSNITTNATGTATGGNINIDTVVIAASENSDITANAQDARGGQVIINAQGIFGTKFRNQLTSESDITASSRLGPQFSGIVEINTPEVDPSQGLVNLPAELVDASRLIAQTCSTGEGQEQSEFIVTGRGGLPPNSSEALSSEPVQVDWVTLNPKAENAKSATVTTHSTAFAPAPLVEAQGWVINNQGEVVLTATTPNVTFHIPWLTPASCQMP